MPRTQRDPHTHSSGRGIRILATSAACCLRSNLEGCLPLQCLPSGGAVGGHWGAARQQCARRHRPSGTGPWPRPRSCRESRRELLHCVAKFKTDYHNSPRVCFRCRGWVLCNCRRGDFAVLLTYNRSRILAAGGVIGRIVGQVTPVHSRRRVGTSGKRAQYRPRKPRMTRPSGLYRTIEPRGNGHSSRGSGIRLLRPAPPDAPTRAPKMFLRTIQAYLHNPVLACAGVV